MMPAELETYQSWCERERLAIGHERRKFGPFSSKNLEYFQSTRELAHKNEFTNLNYFPKSLNSSISQSPKTVEFIGKLPIAPLLPSKMR